MTNKVNSKLDCVLWFFWNWICISRRIKKIKDKSITQNTFKIESDNSILCGFYCIAFIEYMIEGTTLVDYSNLFSPNDYQKNDKIIYKYDKDKFGKRKRKPWL